MVPVSIRDQIGTAYLLARATDTVADTGAVPIEQRLSALKALSQRISGEHCSRLEFTFLAIGQSSTAERTLLERIEEVLALLASFDPQDLAEIKRVLQTITSGQELDLVRFGQANESNLVALGNEGELDDYTYRVAGCVGDFWTRVCFRHLVPKPSVEEEQLVQHGICFGKGLQLVNILRDLPADLRQGRCYLPSSQLAETGLRPVDLLLSQNEPKVRPVYNRWLGLASEHLEFGWKYVLALPSKWLRVRLACAWPILIGRQTIEKLCTENVLNGEKRIKISRGEVRRLVARSLLALPFRQRWASLPDQIGRNVNQVAR